MNNAATLLQGKPWKHETDVQSTWRRFGWKPKRETDQPTPLHDLDDYDRVLRDDWLSAPGGFRHAS